MSRPMARRASAPIRDDLDFLQRYDFYTAGPLERFFINRWRRREGREPFRWFVSDR